MSGHAGETGMAALIVRALWFGLMATQLKGLLIGLSQTGTSWGWFSAPMGFIVGPVYLIPDCLILFGNGPLDAIVVLHWAVAGMALGAASAWFNIPALRKKETA